MSDRSRQTPAPSGQHPTTTIRIDRLRVRYRGVDGDIARAAIAGLGPDLARQLATHASELSSQSIGATALPTIHSDTGHAEALRAATVTAITGAIVSRKAQGGGNR
jgi:hypothetical protein